MSLNDFYKDSGIKTEDRAALQTLGITDLGSLLQLDEKVLQKLHSRTLSDVSDEAQINLRALVHYLEIGNGTYDEDGYHTHLLKFPGDTIKTLEKQTSNSDDDDAFDMPKQGFDPSTVDIEDDDDEEETTEPVLIEVGGPEFVTYDDIQFKKGGCYIKSFTSKGQRRKVILGIRYFDVDKKGQPTNKANCSLIKPASSTFLGQDKPEDNYKVYSSKYVQVWTKQRLVHLSELSNSCLEPTEIPKVCYTPQKDGSRRSMAYFFDSAICHQRIGLRDEKPKVIEFFCGSGGMHLGYKACNFDTIKAIDLNETALSTFRHNNPDDIDAVECICVNKYLRAYKQRRDGGSDDDETVAVLHASSPCQGFSKENRNKIPTENDKRNNELALTFTKGLRKTNALIGIFENVSVFCFGFVKSCLFRYYPILTAFQWKFFVLF